jgi:hypothetical protein
LLTTRLLSQVKAAVAALLTHLARERSSKNALIEEDDMFSLVRSLLSLGWPPITRPAAALVPARSSR